MKAYEEWMFWSTSVSGQLHAPAALPPPPSTGERAPGIFWIGGWVDPRAGVEDVEKLKFFILPGLQLLVVHLVSSRCTDYATAAHTYLCIIIIIIIIIIYNVANGCKILK
jgi:hypothetical protein